MNHSANKSDAQAVAIIGAGGHAREILDVLEAINALRVEYDIRGFMVDPEYAQPGQIINDYPVLGGLEWIANHPEVKVICGIGYPAMRLHLVKRAQALGAQFCTVIHPRAILTKRIDIGDGVIITAGCVLTNNIQIGNHVHINRSSTIGHDCVLGDFATISPGVNCSGTISVGEGSFIGTGVNIIERITIGSWAKVGAGATVIHDVPDNAVSVGVPAQVVKTQEKGWQLR